MINYHEPTYSQRDCAHSSTLQYEFACDVIFGLLESSMDAPDNLPAGSTLGLESIAVSRFACQRTTYRDGWRK